jgi:hypothetical protein
VSDAEERKKSDESSLADYRRLWGSVRQSMPKPTPDPITWAEQFIKLPGSARSKHFRIDVSPWLREPLMRASDLVTRVVTLMKPVQSGGSVFGEIMLLYWIVFGRGFLQYNWSNDKRADERWESRVDGVLKACAIVAEMMEHAKVAKCEINFGHVFFRMQGAFVSDNLDSDSVRLQINEEVHAWEPGHLKKARNRSTAVWDFKSLDVSNAGMLGDQLDQEFHKGTVQRWEVKCPGCGLYHYMRTKWDDRHPELGGLRYDAEGSRLGSYVYNYNVLRPTIRFQMPCGFAIHNEDMSTRKSLSLSGRYSEPGNVGAELSHRSYTYEAVIVDYIDWMQLIKDKHDALRSRSLGDPQPWIKYKQERECIPYDPNDVPIIGLTTVVKGLQKTREGLPGNKLRLFELDRQQGDKSKNEFPHWWLVIRDAQAHEGKLRTRLVFEGKVETDEQVISILDDHKCNRWQGCADSGDDTTHVYLFCLKYGINAIKGGAEEFYSHEGGVRRIFSPEKPLHAMINRESKYAYVDVNVGNGKIVRMPDPREPMFWLYSKPGIRERLYYLRNNTAWETPEDVSEEYHSHMEAEERIADKRPDGSTFYKWVQHKDRNDLFVCECYVAMQIDQAGLILLEMNKPAENEAKNK